MWDLTVCFAIFYFALASGTATNNESKVFVTKFDKKNRVLMEFESFQENTMVYGVRDHVENKWKVYQDSFALDQNTVLTCDVKLHFEDTEYVKFVTAGYNKAFFASFEGNNTRLIHVNMKNCNAKELIVHLGVRELSYNFVIPRENDFVVIFRNEELCHNYFCKTTYDYEGKIIKAASIFNMRYRGDYLSTVTIKSVNKGYLIGEAYLNGFVKVSLIQDDELGSKTLFERNNDTSFLFVSTEENKISFCAQSFPSNTIACMQYDDDANTKIVEAQVALTPSRPWTFLDVRNLEKGFFVTVEEALGDPKHDRKHDRTFIMYINEQGQQVKTLDVDMKCNSTYIIAPHLFKNSVGGYCLSVMCMDLVDGDDILLSRNVKCFSKTELTTFSLH